MPDRDRALEQALGRTRALTPMTDACLDAETAAAWVDGGLQSAALRRARAHVADCARCQALLRSLSVREDERVATPATVDAASPWAAWRRLWTLPVGAAAAAVLALALWLMPPRVLVTPTLQDARGKATDAGAGATGADDAHAEQAPSIAEASSPHVSGAPPVAVPSPADPPPASAMGKGAVVATAPSEQRGDLRTMREASASDAAAPAPPPPSAAVSGALRSRADAGDVPFEVGSPDGAVRWRVRGSEIERSDNSGVTWTRPQPLGSSGLAAGAAPSATVCWLGGRSGVVLRTTDGVTWNRVASPAAVDLLTITATDATVAVVTTVDGRRFETRDGGVSWISR